MLGYSLRDTFELSLLREDGGEGVVCDRLCDLWSKHLSIRVGCRRHRRTGRRAVLRDPESRVRLSYPLSLRTLESVLRFGWLDAILTSPISALRAHGGDGLQHASANLDNPEAFVYAFWEEAMTKFLVNATTFGSYCHEGRDLAMDFLRSRGLSMSNDCLLWTLSDIANRLVEEYKGRYCSYCNDDDEEEGEYDE